MPLTTFDLASDDRYWVYDADSEDLQKFLSRPHEWVKHECKSELAKSFVVMMRCFTRDRDNDRLVMQGIDKTAVVHISTTPLTRIEVPSAIAPYGEIILFPNPSGDADRPWKAYTHLALGADVEVIAKFLMRAAASPYFFLQKLNALKWKLISDEGVEAFGREPKVNFVPRPHQGSDWSPNDGMAIVYQSVAASGDPPVNPPACNSKVGTAYDDNGTLMVEVETFTVKAWP